MKREDLEAVLKKELLSIFGHEKNTIKTGLKDCYLLIFSVR